MSFCYFYSRWRQSPNLSFFRWHSVPIYPQVFSTNMYHSITKSSTGGTRIPCFVLFFLISIVCFEKTNKHLNWNNLLYSNTAVSSESSVTSGILTVILGWDRHDKHVQCTVTRNQTSTKSCRVKNCDVSDPVELSSVLWLCETTRKLQQLCLSFVLMLCLRPAASTQSVGALAHQSCPSKLGI